MMPINDKQKKEILHKTILAIPKTEIHLHIEGLTSVDTIWALKTKHNITLKGISTRDDLYRRFQVENLTDFIDLFINVIQNCFYQEGDFDYLIQDTAAYLNRNNITYAEIFFAPSKFIINGLSFGKLIEHLDQGAQRIKEHDGREVRFIIDVSRSFGPENAMRNLDLTIKHKKPSIIGIGLGGAEQQGPAKDYAKVFDKARDHGLVVVAHAGEDVGPKSIWSAIQDLKIMRIGHGISAIQDIALMDYLRESQIPLEICPMSNIFTKKYVTSYEDHPIRKFYDYGIFTTVNSDDPTIFGTELMDEYINLIEHNIFSLNEAFELIKNNLKATFLDQTEKEDFLADIEKAIRLRKAVC